MNEQQTAPMRYIFLDIETTGLNFEKDQITEIAWIRDTGEERSCIIDHDRRPNQWVVENTDYVERILKAENSYPLWMVLDALSRDCVEMKRASSHINHNIPLSNIYMVGRCPAFDDRFLRKAYATYNKRLGNSETPYHDKVIDIEAMALGKLGLDRMPSLNKLRKLLGIPGDNEPAHRALDDAREVKIIFEALCAK